MNIAEIRNLTRQLPSTAIAIERKCKAAIPRTVLPAERAELFYLCAKAISQQPDRQAEAMQYAERAAALAASTHLFILTVDIACLQVSWLATQAPAEDVQATTRLLRAKITDSWIKRPNASVAELHQAYARLRRLADAQPSLVSA